MQMDGILATIDAEINKLQKARDLIAGLTPNTLPAKRRGRPQGSSKKIAAAPAKAEKRTMSAEGRAQVAAAQKARWAAQKKSAKPAKSVTKQSTSKTRTTKKVAAREE